MTDKPQANQYDKIFRENMEAAIPGLIATVLKINVAEAEEIPDDLQHTKERKPDFLKAITDTEGERFLLHLEIQTTDEPDMVYRMAEYFVMLHRKYRIPVRQHVLYIGPGQALMPVSLREGPLQFSYELIALSSVDYRLFLASNQPEKIILSILADFAGQPPLMVIQQVVSRLRETAPGDLAFNRYKNQLRVLSQLRKLKQLTNDMIGSISEFFREEDDVLYILGEREGEMRGEAKGEAKAVRKLVLGLIEKSAMPVEQIADVAGVSVEYVTNLKNEQTPNQ